MKIRKEVKRKKGCFTFQNLIRVDESVWSHCKYGTVGRKVALSHLAVSLRRIESPVRVARPVPITRCLLCIPPRGLSLLFRIALGGRAEPAAGAGGRWRRERERRDLKWLLRRRRLKARTNGSSKRERCVSTGETGLPSFHWLTGPVVLLKTHPFAHAY